MTRTALVFVLMVGSCLWPDAAQSQTVKVEKKPASACGPDEYSVYDQWTVSYSRVHGPTVFELDSINNTEAKAMARIKDLQAWSNRIEGGGWKLAVILVEAEATCRSNKGPSLPSEERVQNDTLTSLQRDVFKSLNDILTKDVQNVFNKKNQDVKDAFRRGKEAKEFLVRNVDKIAEDDFRKANALVSEYNQMKDKYAAEKEQPQYFAALPRMTPVNAADLQRIREKFQKSQNSLEELQSKKQALDDEKNELDRQRQQLIDAGLDNNAEESEIDQQRRDLEKGPYRISSGLDIINEDFYFGQSRKSFATFAEADALRKKAGLQERARIFDRNGNVVTGPPSDEDAKLVSEREDALGRRRSERQTQVTQYRRALAGYQERLKAYEEGLSHHKQHASNWQDDQYYRRKSDASTRAK